MLLADSSVESILLMENDMEYFGITDIGRVRKENQDTFMFAELQNNDSVAAVVCDGMGGANGGQIASELSSFSFCEYLKSNFISQSADISAAQLLQDAVTYANDTVYMKSLSDKKLRGMGTTLVAGLFIGEYAIFINVGDSRAYIMSSNDGIRQITRDHSLVEDLISKGNITREEAKTHPHKNLITKAIGTSPRCIGDIYKVKLNDGDRILLCSDGLSNVMSDELLYNGSMKYEDIRESCEYLISSALEMDASDNVTAVVIKK